MARGITRDTHARVLLSYVKGLKRQANFGRETLGTLTKEEYSSIEKHVSGIESVLEKILEE